MVRDGADAPPRHEGQVMMALTRHEDLTSNRHIGALWLLSDVAARLCLRCATMADIPFLGPVARQFLCRLADPVDSDVSCAGISACLPSHRSPAAPGYWALVGSAAGQRLQHPPRPRL